MNLAKNETKLKVTKRNIKTNLTLTKTKLKLKLKLTKPK